MTNTEASPRHAAPVSPRHARRRAVWPIGLLLAVLVALSVGWPLLAHTAVDAPPEDTYSPTWDCLLAHGWTGSALDHAERLYPTTAGYVACVLGA